MKASHLFLFATDKGPARAGGLEDRFRAFVRTGDTTEDIDEIRFGQPGSPSVADYLLDKRSLIAELKTLEADPANAIEKRVQVALREARVTVMGRYGLAPILRSIPDGDKIAKDLVQIQGRRVRASIKDASEQIASTRNLLEIEEAAGMVVLLSDKSRLMDATSIAYAIREVLESKDYENSGVHYVVAFIESHSIRLPNGDGGYPILVVKDAVELRPEKEQRFVASMIEYWCHWHGRELFFIDHGGTWDSLYALEPGPAVKTR